MKRHIIASSMALGAALAACAASFAQDTVPVAEAAPAVGVAGTSFELGLFGGGDDNGSFYGATPSLMVPLGDNVGLQVDGIAGVAADELGFFGGAVQLFYREPQSHLIGLAVAGFVEDGESQYTVAGIGEYYLDTITLEALAGYQSGDIIDGSAFARLGASIYAAPTLRLGLGVSYSEAQHLGADAELEYLAAPASGLALFASGAFDEDGALGLVGARFYFNGLGADGEDSEGPSLMAIHRQLGRRNIFQAAPTVVGTRLISQAGSALSSGEGFGDIPAEPAPASSASAGLLSGAGGGSPLGGLLNGILPAGTTGTPLDGVPVVGELVGSLTALASPDTLRIGDLPAAGLDGSLASLPLVGDVLGALPAGGVTALLGSAQPELILNMLAPALLDGLTDPAKVSGVVNNLVDGVVGGVLSSLTGTDLTGGLGGLSGGLSGGGLPTDGVLALLTNAQPDLILTGLVPSVAGGLLEPLAMPGF